MTGFNLFKVLLRFDGKHASVTFTSNNLHDCTPDETINFGRFDSVETNWREKCDRTYPSSFTCVIEQSCSNST